MAGRPSHAKALALWMNGLRVGEWRIPTRGPMELAYDAAWLAAPEARPLSLSLPLPLAPVPLTSAAVGHYFDNLLPDHEPIRRRIASRFRLADTSPFALLAEIGRDCVGALQLLPVNADAPDVRRIDAEPLDEAGVEQALDRAVTPTGGMATAAADSEDEFRISIAGAQDKTALLWHEGRWCRPLGATPTTHLFKLPLGLIGGQSRQIDFRTSVDNEWLCLRLLGLYGLPVPPAQIASFGRHRPLIVERFDRRLVPASDGAGAWWLRLPQEDFCQVFALPPTAKYERDGGPGIVEIAHRLRQSANAQADVENFLSAQILFWMLAAIDGHAKNFSLQLLPQGRYRLTPFYDVLSAWPAAGAAPSQINIHDAKLAMSLRGKNRHRKIFEIQRRHFDSTAQLCGLASAEPLIERILALTPQVLAQAQRELPRGFSQQVLDQTLKGLAEMATRLGAQAS
jgi:serine/threonine-protein kinase HipA